MSNHEERQHALLAPSSSYRWLVCHGAKHGNLLDSDAGEAAERGTLLHEQAERILSGKERITAETEEVVCRYITCVNEQLDVQDFDEDYDHERYIVEHEVVLVSKDLPSIFFGTVDTLIYDTEEKILIAIDMKTGRRPVYAKGNTQLQSYLLLATDDPRFAGAKDFIGIIVSAAIGVDIATYTKRDLTELKKKVKAAAKDDNRVAGGHCEWCPLLKGCNEAREYTAGQMDLLLEEFGDFEPEVVEERMTIQNALKFIELAPVAKKLADHARLFLAKTMHDGTPVPGWKLGVSLKNREWADIAAAEAAMREAGLSDEQIFKRSLLTPAKADAIMGKAAVAELTKRETKGISAVPVSSNLKEYVRGVDVEKFFDEVGEEDA